VAVMMFWYGTHGPGVGWSIIMTLFMLAFWGAIVTLVVYAIRAGCRQGSQVKQPGPKQILAERLARGEIDADEYRMRLEVLSGTADGQRAAR
jgi:putative membrane protein